MYFLHRCQVLNEFRKPNHKRWQWFPEKLASHQSGRSHTLWQSPPTTSRLHHPRLPQVTVALGAIKSIFYGTAFSPPPTPRSIPAPIFSVFAIILLGGFKVFTCIGIFLFSSLLKTCLNKLKNSIEKWTSINIPQALAYLLFHIFIFVEPFESKLQIAQQ